MRSNKHITIKRLSITGTGEKSVQFEANEHTNEF